MLPHDKALALSPVEVELARDLRSRLGRRAVSDKALGALGAAFFQLCGRLGIDPAAQPAEAVGMAAIDGADIRTLARLVARMKLDRDARPLGWSATVAAGLPQAVLSRRLALAGREPARDEAA